MANTPPGGIPTPSSGIPTAGPIVTVKKGLSFTCPQCHGIARRADLSRNLYLYTVPHGHKMEKDNRIVCFFGEKPFIWQVVFIDER